jgi:hypothetical protein
MVHSNYPYKEDLLDFYKILGYNLLIGRIFRGFMVKKQVLKNYASLEKELEEIAFLSNMTVKQLTNQFLELPLYIKEKVRFLLIERIEYLEEMRKWHFEKYGNVLCFPISRT